jgi:uncharacterized protein HemX
LAAARLSLVAAGQTLDTALLNSGTAALVLGTALQALLAAAEFGVRLTAGRFLFAASEFGLTAILGLGVGDGRSGQQQTKDKKRTGKQFRGHGKFSSKCRCERSAVTAQTMSAATNQQRKIVNVAQPVD